MMSATMASSRLSVELEGAPAERWRQGLEQLVQALSQERRSAMVLSEDPQVLEAMAGQLARSLRAQPGVRMEVIQPTSTERLLARFNALLETIPVAQARLDGQGPLTLWVLNLRRELELPEVRLLLNLVQDFPGAGVRLLILCAREAAAQRSVRFAASWGSRLHRWVIAADEGAVSTPAPRRMEAPTKVHDAAPVATAVVEATTEAHEAARAGWRAVLRPRFPAWSPRWAWGLGGVVLSLFGATTTWLLTRSDAGDPSLTPPRRPVPEMVELLEDMRPTAVRQERPS